MELSNIVIPGLILAAPIFCSLVFLLPMSADAPRLEKKISLSLLAFQIVVAFLGVLKYESEIRVGFILPFASDASGYFDFALSLHWMRFIWIVGLSFCLLALTLFEADRRYSTEFKKVRFLFLAGVSLFSSLAVLSENILLSIMFIEIVFFLFHADALLLLGDDVTQEKDSFFRRAVFVLLGLAAILILNSLSVFGSKAIILVSALLYVGALIFSRHNFVEWASLPINTLKLGLSLFLLNKIMKSDLAPELWFSVGVVFGIVSMFFSVYAMLTNKHQNASFWTLFSCFSYLLFLRFYSGYPHTNYWGIYEVVALLGCYSMALMMRYCWADGKIIKRVLGFIVGIFFLSIISGAIPGADIISHDIERKIGLLDCLVWSTVTFLLSLNVGKKIMSAVKRDEQAETLAIPFWSPAIVVFILQLCVVIFFIHISSSTIEEYLSAFMRPEVQIFSATVFFAILFGVLAGALIGANGKYRNWVEKKEFRLPEFVPNISSYSIVMCEKIILSPNIAVSWILQNASKHGEIITSSIERADNFVFAKKLQEIIGYYVTLLSMALRRVHSGNVRLYFLIGALVALIGSVIISAGGK